MQRDAAGVTEMIVDIRCDIGAFPVKDTIMWNWLPGLLSRILDNLQNFSPAAAVCWGELAILVNAAK